MLRPIDQWFNDHPEPSRECLAALRDHIRRKAGPFEESWKYRMPFYCLSGRMSCYLWVQRKTGWPYLGIVEGTLFNDADLIAEKRTRMKILPVDPDRDIPVERIDRILGRLVVHYTGKSN